MTATLFRRTALSTPLALVLLGLSACGDGTSADSTPNAPAEPVETATAAETAEPTVLAAADTGSTAPAATSDPMDANWLVDYDMSRIAFSFSQFGNDASGTFASWDANIQFDESDLANAKAVVTILLTSAQTGDAERDGSLAGGDWFDTDRHPTARFETTAFRKTGDNTYEADATLTIKGESQPITLPFTLVINDGEADMSGAVVLDRTAFGLGDTDNVSDEVTVNVTVAAEQVE